MHEINIRAGAFCLHIAEIIDVPIHIFDLSAQLFLLLMEHLFLLVQKGDQIFYMFDGCMDLIQRAPQALQIFDAVDALKLPGCIVAVARLGIDVCRKDQANRLIIAQGLYSHAQEPGGLPHRIKLFH